MKFVVVGGTHGNEKLGVDIVKSLGKSPIKNVKALIGNPLAVKRRVRYIDFDLNRAVKNDKAKGNEKERAEILSTQINSDDFVIDVHTTTSNMGYSLILSKSEEHSSLIAREVKRRFKKVTIVYSSKLDQNSNFINRLSDRGFVFEVGPCPHNTYRKTQLKYTREIIEFISTLEISNINKNGLPNVFFKVKDYVPYSSIDDKFFNNIKNQDYVKFPDVDCKVKNTSGNLVNLRNTYPIFIGEKSYVETGIAFSLCEKGHWEG